MAKLSPSAVVARKNYGTLKRFREVQKSAHYRELARQYAERHGQALSNTVAATSKFARLYGKAHIAKSGKWKAPTHAGSMRARLLEAVGSRPEGATYAIGETPKRR